MIMQNLEAISLAIYKQITSCDPASVSYDRIVINLICRGVQADPDEWRAIRELLVKMVDDGVVEIAKPATKTTFAEYSAL